MTADDDILFRTDGALGRVHLNAPGTFNSLTREMCVAFREANAASLEALRGMLVEAGVDDDAAAAVVDGAFRDVAVQAHDGEPSQVDG